MAATPVSSHEEGARQNQSFLCVELAIKHWGFHHAYTSYGAKEGACNWTKS